MKIERSNFLAIPNARDIISGAFLAFISSIVLYATDVLTIMQDTGSFDFSWQSLIDAALKGLGVAGLYLIKNLFSNKEGIPLKK